MRSRRRAGIIVRRLRTEDTDPAESLRRWHKVRALLADAAVSPETTSLRIQACRGILSAYLAGRGLGGRLRVRRRQGARRAGR